PLFQVDSTELAAQVAQLAAQRDLAQQDLARAKDLVAQNAASTADLQRAEATARGAEAQYRLQSTRLGRTTVRAPFAGVVGQRFGPAPSSSRRKRSCRSREPTSSGSWRTGRRAGAP